jgi:predicted membrane channel-forming protein YqfA (hemolysin III family)
MASPITDAGDAQAADLALRNLRFALVVMGAQWLLVAGLLALRTNVAAVVPVLVALVGVVYTVGVVGYVNRLRATRLAHFRDTVTGCLDIPGERKALALKARAWGLLVPLDIAALVTLYTSRH